MDILAKNLLVLASAGSGKTFQLGNRILALIGRGVPPGRIAALTFTRKAAGEFADSVLSKLARAASDPRYASGLARDLRLDEPDFPAMLESTVRGLPDITFGTMDGFFASVVRGFQFELGLTGGTFDLVEGPRARMIADDLISSLLGSALDSDHGERFLHAFRRASIGREEQGVITPLRRSVEAWHETLRSREGCNWSEPPVPALPPSDWEASKHQLASRALESTASIEFTRKGQREALEDAIRNVAAHTPGSGSLNQAGSLLSSLFSACAEPGTSLAVRYYKDFVIEGASASAIRNLVTQAASAEVGAAIQRTDAIRELVEHYEERRDTLHCRAGRLGFSDVKHLMGRWARDEEARLRREEVDFRLDSRTDHWLLDEFQDTSRSDWNALHPLLDEAITREDATAFIVGDRKQAIYAWRGGDVELFDEISNSYGPGFKTEAMVESWRSSPEVLSVVNRICGDKEVLASLFGAAAKPWIRDWEDHVSASELRKPGREGFATVELVGDRETRFARMLEILKDNGVGIRAITCGILFRSNSLVRDAADYLRNEGFDVIEEGNRLPAWDDEPGVLVHQLLRWLCDPTDRLALETLFMSPLGHFDPGMDENGITRLWSELTIDISRNGFSATIEQLFNELVAPFSAFGFRRFEEIVSQLSKLDETGSCSLREALEWIRNLEISQSPGIGSVQVMTVHKSKGLGFDLVLIPEVVPDVIPKPQQFEIAEGPGWIMQAPPLWARRMFPPLRAAEEDWGAKQRYEEICGLYVALTRAKRGLHVLLDVPSQNKESGRASLSDWLNLSVGNANVEIGKRDWNQSMGETSKNNLASTADRIPKNSGSKASTSLPRAKRKRPGSLSSVAAGNEMHRLLQSITWLDDPREKHKLNDARLAWLQKPAINTLLSRNGRSIEILREQPLGTCEQNEAVMLVMDRIHHHFDDGGKLTKIEVIDFKTDRVTKPADLVSRHQDQLQRYAAALREINPDVDVVCILVSTRLGELVHF